MNKNSYTIEYVKDFLSNIECNATLLSEEYVDNKTKLKFKCDCGKEFTKCFSNIQQRKIVQCRKCSAVKRHKRQREESGREEKIRKRFEDNGLTLLEDIKNIKDKILCKTKDDYYGRISYTNLEKGKMFSYFSLRYNKDYFLQNLNNYCKLNNIETSIISYKHENKQTMENIIVCKCKCGNIFEVKLNSFLYSFCVRCPKCSKSQSSYEYKVEKELKNLSVTFEKEFVFKDCRNPKTNHVLFFDFYLPDKNAVIEVHGPQHFEYFHHYGKTTKDKIENFNETQMRDKIKEEYAKQNKIKYLMIHYSKFSNNEYIKCLKNFIENL